MLTVGEGADARTIAAVEVRIANGAFHGGTELVEDAEVDSGRIIVQAVLGRSRIAGSDGCGCVVIVYCAICSA